MTAIWRTRGRGSGCVVRDAGGCRSTRSYVRWWRRSSSWRWSPEQIAAWLRSEFPDRSEWHVCHETIYQALYLGGRGGLQRQLTKRLRTGRPLRKRRRRACERRTRFVTPGRLIDQRPDIVARRERVGDWEGDLIVGRGSRSAIATLVDRRSRYVQLVALPRGHDATAVRDALIATFAQLWLSWPRSGWRGTSAWVCDQRRLPRSGRACRSR